jgi:hypothetical protein
VSTSPQTRAAHHRQFALAAALTAATLLAFAVVLFSDAAPGTRQIVSDVGFVVVATAACASWLLALRRNQHRPLAWKLLAITTGSWAVGNMSWFYFQLIADSQPYPGPHDAFYFIALFAAIGALITFPAERVPQGERLRWILDAVIVGGSVLFTSAVLALGKIFTTEVGGSLAKGVYIAYPIADLIVGTLAILLLARAGRGSRLQLASSHPASVPTRSPTRSTATRPPRARSRSARRSTSAGWPAMPARARRLGSHRRVGPRRKHAGRAHGLTRATRAHARAAGRGGRALGRSADRLGAPVAGRDGRRRARALGTRQVLLAVDNAALRRDLEPRSSAGRLS